MTLQDFINKHNGIKVGDGQCGTLVRAYWNEVDHTVPPSYPNSKDYWPNPTPGYDKVTSNPQPGDIAIYNGHGAFVEGHSAIYVGNGQVFEQNADPDGSAPHLYSRANTYLLGYLRKQGGQVSASQDVVDETAVRQAYNAGLLRDPTQAEIDARINAKNTLQQMQTSILASDEHKTIIAKVNAVNATVLKTGLYEVK